MLLYDGQWFSVHHRWKLELMSSGPMASLIDAQMIEDARHVLDEASRVIDWQA